MQTPAYTVIIPSFQRHEMLREAVASVLRQTVTAKEIFVIVDEPENRAAYQDLHAIGSPVHISYTGGGRGAAYARNIGLERATSDYVFFLDDDDLWLPDKVESQIALFKKRPECIGVTCWRMVESGDGNQTAQVTDAMVNNDLFITNHIGSFSFFGMRRDAKTSALRLDERFAASQDLDFYISLSAHGCFGVVPKVLARYRMHGHLRITDGLENRISARRLLITKHAKVMSWRELQWNEARVLSMQATDAKTGIAAFILCIRAAARLISSGWISLGSFRMVWWSWRARKAHTS